ncbi:bactofilin family protein [Limibacillus halophilus]|uniref:Cytoskeletal protein CcmA (Bactofilin family) n=1 Tax=Limibacillus halophilus TaxID=1579333 RepID=A0A839SLM2_9PROT|nr:polymer-forming cytoskeletal protein [Limibacillus halophilus]MBB3063797.1 cytoskeletal protein CcmA (bactofilin family) [Limibacillus halophilus]
MFGKKNKDGGNNPSDPRTRDTIPRGPRPAGTEREETRPLRRTTGELPLTPPSRQEFAGPTERYDPTERYATSAPRTAEPSPPPVAPVAPAPSIPGTRDSSEGEGQRLSVGKGISLTGEIRNCESLFVEGEVEVKLTDCKWLKIAAGGLVKGTATVENAEISGSFIGELTVRGCLSVKRGGLVEGDTKYTELEIERGGRLTGKSDKNELDS